MKRKFGEKIYGSIEKLYEDLKLPDTITISQRVLLTHIGSMKDPDYQKIIVEHYINGKPISQVKRDNPELYFEDLYSAKDTAISKLRKYIINDCVPSIERPIGEFVEAKVLFQLGLDNEFPVYAILEEIMSFDYKQSVGMDIVINTLQHYGFEFDYPEFLKCRPSYPANLYCDYLENDGIRSKLSVKELWNLHKEKLNISKDYTYENFEKRANLFLDPNLGLFNRFQIQIIKAYYVDQLSTTKIYEKYDIPEATVKYQLHKVIKCLNSPEILDFIYNGLKNVKSDMMSIVERVG